MTPKQAAILYWRNDNPPQELIAAMAEAQRPLLEALEAAVKCGMVPVSSAKEGGANKYSIHVRVADMIRAAIAATKGE